MAAIVVFVMVLISAVKTASYGVWELKRRNKAGGSAVIVIAALGLVLAGRYLIEYLT
ncbi:MAG: hypothetical protein IK057_04215 [Clostridia bacterium]|nr:hypothetical protein [Clostridia bacterium]